MLSCTKGLLLLLRWFRHLGGRQPNRCSNDVDVPVSCVRIRTTRAGRGKIGSAWLQFAGRAGSRSSSWLTWLTGEQKGREVPLDGAL